MIDGSGIVHLINPDSGQLLEERRLLLWDEKQDVDARAQIGQPMTAIWRFSVDRHDGRLAWAELGGLDKAGLTFPMELTV